MKLEQSNLGISLYGSCSSHAPLRTIGPKRSRSLQMRIIISRSFVGCSRRTTTAVDCGPPRTTVTSRERTKKTPCLTARSCELQLHLIDRLLVQTIRHVLALGFWELKRNDRNRFFKNVLQMQVDAGEGLCCNKIKSHSHASTEFYGDTDSRLLTHHPTPHALPNKQNCVCDPHPVARTHTQTWPVMHHVACTHTQT